MPEKTQQVASYMQPLISNIIATCLLSTSTANLLDLQQIAQKVEGSRLNTRKFPGLIIRKSNPKGTIIVFKSRKVVLIGCSSIQNCEVLSKKLAKDLSKILNVSMGIESFKISNIIANARLGYRVNIGNLATQKYAHKDDRAPGVLVKLKEIKSAIVFSSGKIILNGATKM